VLRATLHAVFWAATWGAGVALGVALGGWLTVVGGAGAPGTESLDIAEDVLLLPGLAGTAVFVVHLVAGSFVRLVRMNSAVSRESDSDEAHDE
jgi:hypothetical protein